MSLTYTQDGAILPFFRRDGSVAEVDISNRSTGNAPCLRRDGTFAATAGFLSRRTDEVEVHVVGPVGGALRLFSGFGFEEAVTLRRWQESLAFARVAVEDRLRLRLRAAKARGGS